MGTRRLAGLVPGLRGRVLADGRASDERDRLRADLQQALTGRREAEARADRAEAALEDAAAEVARRLAGPSFYHRLEALKRERRHARERYGVLHPVLEHDPKAAGQLLAQRCGVAVPEQLVPPAPLGRLTEPDHDTFVVKPNVASSMRGVFPLVRVGDDRYRSLLDEGTLSWGDVLDGIARAHAATPRSDGTTLVEELIPGFGGRALPLDWKLYCIGARVELALAKDSRGSRLPRDARFRFFDRSFEDLGAVRHVDRIDPELPPPRHPGQLVHAAESIAAQIPGPFVRVDLFEREQGVVFGEITPYPGGTQLFSPEVDLAMGAAWERAEGTRLARHHGTSTA